MRNMCMGALAASLLSTGGGGGPGVITFNWLGDQSSTAGVNPTTFPAFSWPNPAGDRRIVVGIIINDDPGPTAVTVGGIAATKISEGDQASGGSSHSSDFWIANVPTGTSGDIVVTLPAAESRMYVTAWEVFGILSNTPFSALYTNGLNNNSISVSANGLVLAMSGITASTQWRARAGDYLSVVAAEPSRAITLDNSTATNITGHPVVAVGGSTLSGPSHIHEVTFEPS